MTVVAAATMAFATPAQASGQALLVGTFRLNAGSCNGGQATGSTFRMVLPNGSPSGPFVSNNDSPCDDHSYTPLTPGTDGGLITGAHQPEPDPAFDGDGNSLASRITKPARFYGVDFSTSTNPTDPQTQAKVGPPSVTTQDGKLAGDLRAFAASWNRQEFNQGAPKPDGSSPGLTSAPSGTYDAATGAFSLNWASQIQGGPFNNFTGLWHLEGTFVPASRGGGASGSPTTAPAQNSPTNPSANRSSTATTTSAAIHAAPKTTVVIGAAAPGAPTTTAIVEQGGTPAGGSTPLTALSGSPTAAAPAAASSKTHDDGKSSVGPAGFVAVLALLGVGGWLGFTQIRTRTRRSSGVTT